MDFLNNFLFSLAQGETTSAASQGGSFIGMMLPMLFIIVFFWFIMIRPQKKKEQQANQMRQNVQVGDEIATIGGIVGIVIKKAEDTIVIETGGDKSRLRIKTWAVQENITAREAAEAAAKEAKAAKRAQLPDKDKE
ncbi:MAG: preprotein translocase subunit YajC [Oscillospiraceae bacterium]|jgi:preprotein translocase subunit YajC|nr:preprotein translocase subunit YajC [Oscillospiraceae bacterium]